MKKNTRRFLSLISLCLVASTMLASLASCKKDDTPSEDTTQGEETTTNDQGGTPVEPSDEINYTVEVVSAGGLVLEGVKFDVLNGNDTVASGEITSEGKSNVKLKAGLNYKIRLSNVPDGYDVNEAYTFTGTSAKIVLTSHVIDDTNLDGVSYKVGSVMHDFTVTTIDGKEFTLSEVLKEKKCAFINFFYVGCSPCKDEFPYMNAVTEEFKDSVGSIAINPLPTETEQNVKDFRDNNSYTMNMAKTGIDLASAFGVSAFPTSVFIDRYGVICLIEVGGLPSETPFRKAFEHFTNPLYQQQLFTSIGELQPLVKVDIEMPSSDEIKNAVTDGSFNISFRAEDNPETREYAWPFVIDENEKNVIKTTNSKLDNSFSRIYIDVELKAGQAFGFDYFTETEKDSDIFYIRVDGRLVYNISGVSTEYESCYPCVAKEDGTYTLMLTYIKSAMEDTGDDIVKLKNLRVIDAKDIDVATYIPRYIATERAADGMGYNKYEEIYYNENDGYYHVYNENGPLVFANLMGSTPFAGTGINYLAAPKEVGGNGPIMYDGKDIYQEVLDGNRYTLEWYANFSINGLLYGYCPVTEELRSILEAAAQTIGEEKDNPKEWMQMCTYYDAYGTDKQLKDPIKGLAFFSAYEAIETKDPENVIKNSFTYTHSIMPRGYLAKFTPEKSGIYLIRSYGDTEVDGWIFNESDPHTPCYEYEFTDRNYSVDGEVQYSDTWNVYMIVYLTAGKDYYLTACLIDPSLTGTIEYSVQYLAAEDIMFKMAASGPFTTRFNDVGDMNEIIAPGIDVKLGNDGLFYSVNKDGEIDSESSKLYADFTNPTETFDTSIMQMIELGAFDFRYSDIDMVVIAKKKAYTDKDGKFDKEACIADLKEYYEDMYESLEQVILEAINGKYHGAGVDYTERVKEIANTKMIKEEGEKYGCVEVDEELANILQLLMDKYTFAGVETSWRKLCFYYEVLNEKDSL